jgi:hypothetical protein
VSDLSEETRLLLLVAALNDSDDVGEVLHAAASSRTVRFRHPLI